MEEIEAIVKFDKLRNYLESIGIHVAEASADGYHAVKPGEVTLQAIKDGTYTFDEDGIYLNGSNGVRQKVYLYKIILLVMRIVSHACILQNATR